jgi:hypothetical protein
MGITRMMYSPINIRPYFPKPTSGSYWYLSMGYFNVILPKKTTKRRLACGSRPRRRRTKHHQLPALHQSLFSGFRSSEIWMETTFDPALGQRGLIYRMLWHGGVQ